MTPVQQKYLPVALIVVGIAFLGLYLMMAVFPEAWTWEPRQPEYEQMIMGVYAVLGIFLLVASRKPENHLSLIWFTIVSSAVHGLIMLVQALVDPAEQANFYGDIPALLIVAVVLALLTPRRFSPA